MTEIAITVVHSEGKYYAFHHLSGEVFWNVQPIFTVSLKIPNTVKEVGVYWKVLLTCTMEEARKRQIPFVHCLDD